MQGLFEYIWDGGLRFCLSNRFPGNAFAAALQNHTLSSKELEAAAGLPAMEGPCPVSGRMCSSAQSHRTLKWN